MNPTTNEASYLRLANDWRRVHPVERAPRRWPKIVVAIAALILLSPVIGMVLVFAVLPALPLVLAMGTVLGPVNLIAKSDREEENESFDIWEQRRHSLAPA